MTDPQVSGASRASSNMVMASLRFVLLFAATIVIFWIIFFQRALARGPRGALRASSVWVARWGRVVCSILGYRVRVIGVIPPGGVLLAPNHQGYVDIFTLSAATGCFFVPKGDIGSWPVVGFIVRQSGQVLTSRRRGAKDMKHTADRITDYLREGFPVCVFLEGTSTGGDRVLPYRASFVQPALDAGVPVVPVGIRYRSMKKGVHAIDDVAYWKEEHHFLRHLFRHLGLSPLEAEIHFGEPLPANDADRKQLAQAAWERTARLALEIPAPGS
jgi:1-acyl-sn-glycerol-3-phosphate acyltransferase